MRLRLSILSILIIIGSVGKGQEATGEFKDLESALLQPEQVVSLTLKRKRLKEWPDELRDFPNLTRLDLSNNKIDSLPKDLTYLSKLEYLNLTSNKLDSLPDAISQLVNLNQLLVGNNEIYHITHKISNLEKLEEWELWSNNIYYLPVQASELKNLRLLDLRNIQLNKSHQESIKSMFKEGQVKIRFSMSCDCD